MRRTFLGKIALALCVSLVTTSCDRSETQDSTARHYEVRGIVRGFAPDRSTIDIEHEDIPGLMPSMTMPFTGKNQKEIADLKIEDAISFRMTVTDKDLFIDQVKRIAASDVHLAEPHPTARPSTAVAARLREGDILPSFSLTNQDGARVSLDTFRGQQFVLTFVFTRCAIPKFCPLISRNFSELQDAIKADEGAAAKTRLLSITLDPHFDTPDILKSYAQQEKADPNIWTFATGDPAEIDALTQRFSVFVQPEGGTISHGLATALIGSEGKVLKIWRGNFWKPSEVIDAFRSAAK